MGRRSFEESGTPLPGVFRTIVVSRQAQALTDHATGVEGSLSFGAAIQRAREIAALEDGDDAALLQPRTPSSILIAATDQATCIPARRMIWVCGGERIYASALPIASHLALTTVRDSSLT